jgi:hypothetical protein
MMVDYIAVNMEQGEYMKIIRKSFGRLSSTVIKIENVYTGR